MLVIRLPLVFRLSSNREKHPILLPSSMVLVDKTHVIVGMNFASVKTSISVAVDKYLLSAY